MNTTLIKNTITSDAPESVKLKTTALALYAPPFCYKRGYIFDSKGNMVADDDGVESAVITRIRGWGGISHLPQAAQLQDTIGEMVAQALTDYWDTNNGKV
jgi:hypothetical protein